ncbi:MAG: sigma-54 dependent transcriptional regulator [Pseudomonadota bacterium]
MAASTCVDIAVCADVPELDGLDALLRAQRLSFSTEDADITGCHTLLVGATETRQADLIARAKRLGAKRIVQVSVGASTSWQTREELGGRLIHIDMPAIGKASQSDADIPTDSALMMLAQLLAAPFGALMAADPASSELIDLARCVASHDVSVFINGPTGSGKEVLSRYIHAASPRAAAPFIALNCAAIPENMLEAMLFGHEKGAFTGAAAANQGHVRAAEGGTLLLDEISEMPIGLQAKLLRVIQEKAVTPVGSQAEISVDVRLIATSNRDMEAEVARGAFREDLYYRLNVFPVATLALAERPRDIASLAQGLLARHAQGAVPLLSAAAMEALAAHDWPGNVRELENVMQRALVLARGPEIGADDIVIAPRAGLMRAFQTVDAMAAPAREAA